MANTRRLSRILDSTRQFWDVENVRPDVRREFRKVVVCRTMTLGAEVYASESGEERIVPHTCKSRMCPSCGQRQNLQWLRERSTDLPEIPYSHIVLTMPDHFWPIFQANRHLLQDLPTLGAAVIQRWVRRKYGARLLMTVMPHTFGRDLKFNCHLHVMVSQGGLTEDGRWVSRLHINMNAMMRMWRYAVIALLRAAYRRGVLVTSLKTRVFARLLDAQYQRVWHVYCGNMRSKWQVLRYAGRYVRRPPLAEHRIQYADAGEVRFLTKDLKTQKTVETNYSSRGFIERLSHHVPDRYIHQVRYFGLLAPRAKGKLHDLVFEILGQQRRGKPKRLPWAESLEICFGTNPLMDSNGHQMRWVGRISPR